jgi:hypothetical protein
MSSSEASSPAEFDMEEDDVVEPEPSNLLVNVTHESEVLPLRRKYTKITDNFEEVADEEVAAAEKSSYNDQNCAFNWKKLEDLHGIVHAEEATIYCPNLRRVLEVELHHCPFIHWSGPRLRFRTPFYPLIHNWDRLHIAAERLAAEPGCGSHLKRLLEKVRSSVRVKSYLDHLEQSLSEGTIQWDDLGKLFPPGEMVFATVSNEPRVFRIHNTGVDDRRDEPLTFILYCWSYGMNLS